MVTGQTGQSGHHVMLSVEAASDRGTEPARILLPRTVGESVRAWPCRARAATVSHARKTSAHRQVILGPGNRIVHYIGLLISDLLCFTPHPACWQRSNVLLCFSGCLNNMVLVTEEDCLVGRVKSCSPTCSHLSSTSNCTATCVPGKNNRSRSFLRGSESEANFEKKAMYFNVNILQIWSSWILWNKQTRL